MNGGACKIILRRLVTFEKKINVRNDLVMESGSHILAVKGGRVR